MYGACAGIFGNSDPLKVDEWISIEVQGVPSRTANADEHNAQRICTEMISSVDYEFVTMKVGSIANPQYKIVSASMSVQTSTWTFRQPVNTQKQAFPIKTTVTFLAMDQAADQFVPIMPAIIPELPWDVLYPFVSQSGLYCLRLTLCTVLSLS